VHNGDAELWLRGETYEDLDRLEALWGQKANAMDQLVGSKHCS
jgi:hypothetical protein